MLRAVIVVLLTLVLAGCAGHESRVETALAALDRGAPSQALDELNAELEVESSETLPPMEGDNALLVLDRATILQSVDRHKLSQRDYGAADKAIDLLDMSRGAADELGRYLFSDDVGPYRAPPFEKLLINTFNMMNYLARSDLSGARVEARRLTVVQRYLKDQESTTALVGLGSYLAGFTMEKSGRHPEALRFYEEALGYQQYPSLRSALRVMTAGRSLSPQVDALVADAGALEPLAKAGQGELVVVVGYGRVPPKLPVRIPIGLALTIVAGSISPHDHAQANALAAKGLVTWVNFPRLGKTRGRHGLPRLWVDGKARRLEHALDVEAELRKEWERHEPTVVLAAITRMVARIIAGEAVQAGVDAASDSGILGLLAGLATSATLAATDTPDTRSWSTLPSNVAIVRLRLPAGQHDLQIESRGTVKRYRVSVAAGAWRFIPVFTLR